LGHIWLSGKNATDHDLVPELLRAREARAKLKHAILAVSLSKRIAALKADESDSDSPEMADAEAGIPTAVSPGEKKPNLLKEKVKSGAVFREVVMGAVKDQKAKEEAAAAEAKELEEARRRSQV
jgi:calcium/calmodulin-dependent protein kinase I